MLGQHTQHNTHTHTHTHTPVDHNAVQSVAVVRVGVAPVHVSFVAHLRLAHVAHGQTLGGEGEHIQVFGKLKVLVELGVVERLVRELEALEMDDQHVGQRVQHCAPQGGPLLHVWENAC